MHDAEAERARQYPSEPSSSWRVPGAHVVAARRPCRRGCECKARSLYAAHCSAVRSFAHTCSDPAQELGLLGVELGLIDRAGVEELLEDADALEWVVGALHLQWLHRHHGQARRRRHDGHGH